MGYRSRSWAVMPRIALTDDGIGEAKPLEKSNTPFDSLGLFVLVTPNGSTLWRQTYTHHGKERMLLHGACPGLDLGNRSNLTATFRALR